MGCIIAVLNKQTKKAMSTNKFKLSIEVINQNINAKGRIKPSLFLWIYKCWGNHPDISLQDFYIECCAKINR